MAGEQLLHDLQQHRLGRLGEADGHNGRWKGQLLFQALAALRLGGLQGEERRGGGVERGVERGKREEGEGLSVEGERRGGMMEEG